MNIYMLKNLPVLLITKLGIFFEYAFLFWAFIKIVIQINVQALCIKTSTVTFANVADPVRM